MGSQFCGRIGQKGPCKTLSAAVLLSLVLALHGCGGNDGPERYRITGTVTFDGKPVPFGSIIFTPDAKQGNSGPQGGATIVDGEFDTGSDRGPVGGPHEVRIDGVTGMPTSERPDASPLFQGFVVTKDLPAEETELEIEVPKEAGVPERRGPIDSHPGSSP